MKPPANLSSDISSLTFHKRTLGGGMFSEIRTSLQQSRPAIMRGMISVTEPQVWTMIGLMGAVFFGTMTLISTMFTRVVRSEISGLRGWGFGLAFAMLVAAGNALVFGLLAWGWLLKPVLVVALLAGAVGAA